MTDPAFIMAFAAILTAVATLWQQKRGKKTDDSTVTSQITTAASTLVHDLGEEIDRLKNAIGDLQHLVSALESEIVTLGGDPNRIRYEVAQLRRMTDLGD